MDDPNITTEDLYGGTPPPPPPPPQIPVEETPEIPMEPVGTPPPPPMPKVSHGSTVVVILIFLILFVAGIFLSSHIRPLLNKVENVIPQISTPAPLIATPTPVDPFAGWKTYSETGVSYALPPTVLAPICDSSGCASKGAYLPGGTRLTIAPKNVTKALSALHGAVITDINGTAFTSTDATISGHVAIEYSGKFSGTTSGGYGFTQMHGFMIEVSPTETLEMNHFTPTGATVDWVKDDALFTQIISKLNFTGAIPATGSGGS